MLGRQKTRPTTPCAHGNPNKLALNWGLSWRGKRVSLGRGSLQRGPWFGCPQGLLNRAFLCPSFRKRKLKKKRKIKKADSRSMEKAFSMPGDSQYMTQKASSRNLELMQLTKITFRIPAQTQNYCTLIFRGRVRSIFQFSAISEYLKLKGGQGWWLWGWPTHGLESLESLS